MSTTGRHRRWLLPAVALSMVGAAALFVLTGSESGSQIVAPLDQYDPVAAGEELPEGYRVGFDRDQIAPVYDPAFTSAGAVDWPADSLVIGVAGETEAKAYPVTHLNSREMVVDSLAGIPILVTW